MQSWARTTVAGAAEQNVEKKLKTVIHKKKLCVYRHRMFYP